MIINIGFPISSDDEKNTKLIEKKILEELEKKSVIIKPSDFARRCICILEKKSVDARKGKVKFFLKYSVYIDEKPEEKNSIPEWKNADPNKKICIIGCGPAGLFAALKLLEHGVTPIIIERGSTTSTRKIDIAKISTQNILNDESNYCFGEGGAGTFSDGKLYTRSNKRGDISGILKILNYFGADKKILTDAHPHIGTDKLPQIINSIRNFIISKGGKIYFDTKLTGFILNEKTICGIKTNHTKNNETNEIYCDAVILATGHSANDIYELLAKTDSSSLEAKTFAVGVRVEHPRELIDSIQYHGKKTQNLGAAEYRIVAQIDERGVYSFCMCPGGFVVPSQSSQNQIVVNGMSAAGRNSRWSNAAIVVETRPEDLKDFILPENAPEVLRGLYWRTALEEKAYSRTNCQKAPAQRLTDFIEEKKSESLPETSYTPGIISDNLNQWIPHHISSRLKKAFKVFNNQMKGYITDEALMIAIETRTSTPVRILRNKETFESPALKNLFPAGEGSGYAGGIVSSAMDGENTASAICKNKYKNN